MKACDCLIGHMSFYHRNIGHENEREFFHGCAIRRRHANNLSNIFSIFGLLYSLDIKTYPSSFSNSTQCITLLFLKFSLCGRFALACVFLETRLVFPVGCGTSVQLFQRLWHNVVWYMLQVSLREEKSFCQGVTTTIY